jgi:hypothetical protein
MFPTYVLTRSPRSRPDPPTQTSLTGPRAVPPDARSRNPADGN